MTTERRVRWWPAMVLTGLFGLIGVWAGIGVMHRTGLTPSDPDVRRLGTAEIMSCARDPLDMWLTLDCDARVHWQGEPRPADKVVRVRAIHRLEGTVNVREQYESRNSWTVLSVDVPVKEDGALFFLVMMGFLSLGMVGWLTGYRLARLLPEPPVGTPKKLTFKSRMSSRRDRDSRFNNRRRR